MPAIPQNLTKNFHRITKAFTVHQSNEVSTVLFHQLGGY